MDTFGLGIIIEYQDKASEGLLNTTRIFNQANMDAEKMSQAIDSNMKKFAELSVVSSNIDKVGSSLSGVGGAITGALGKTVKESTSMQKELQTLQFTSGKTGEAFEELRRVAVQTGIDTAFSPQEATQAMYNLMSAGLNTKDTLASLNNTLDLVANSSGAINLDDGAALVASTLKKFNLEATESKRVVDQMAEATKVSNFHFEDFSAFINSLQASPSSINRPLEEFLGAGAMLRNVGQGAAQAGSTVNGFARQLSQLTKQLDGVSGGKSAKANVKKTMMEKLGLTKDTIWDAENQMRPLQDILTDIVGQMSTMDEKTKLVSAQTLFGDQAKNLLMACESADKAMLKLDETTGHYVATTKDGKTTISEMVEHIKSANGTASEGAQEMLKTQWGIEKLWEGSKQTFSILLGNTILPIVGKFIQTLTKALNVLISFTDAHPKIAKVLGLGTGLAGLLLLTTGFLVSFVGKLGMAFAGFGMMTHSIIPFVSQLIGVGNTTLNLSGIIGGLGSKLFALATPFLRLASVVGIMYVAWRTDFLGVRSLLNWFIQAVHTAWTESTRIAGLGVDAFDEEVRRLAESDSLWDKICLGLIRLKVLWQSLCEAWNTNELSDETFQKAGELGLLPLISKILDAKQVVLDMWEGFKLGFQQISQGVAKAFEGVFQAIADAIGKLIPSTEILDTFQTQFEGIDEKKWWSIGQAIAYVTTALLGITAIVKVVGVIKSAFSIAKVVVGALDTVLSAIGLVMRAGGTLISGVFKFVGVIGTMVTTLLGMAGIVVTIPAWLVGVITMAVVGLVALIVYNWNSIVEFSKWALNSICDFFKWAWNSICDACSSAWEFIKGVFEPVGEFFSNVGNAIVTILLGAWQIIKGTFQIAWGVIVLIVTGIVEVIKTIVAPIIDFFKWVWNGISEACSSAWDYIKSIVSNWFEWVLNKISPLIDFFSSIWNSIKDITQVIWDNIQLLISSVSDTLKGIWQSFCDFMSELWNNISSVASSIWSSIGDFIIYIASYIESIWNEVSSFFSSLWNSIYSTASEFWDAICSVAQSASNSVQSAWDSVCSFFSGIWSSIKSGAQDLFDYLSSKFAWVSQAVSSIQSGWASIKEGAGNIGAGLGDIVASGKSMLGLSTGGYIMQEGAAVLHPNEVVLNSRLTQGLGEFLESQENADLDKIQITPYEEKDTKESYVQQVTNIISPQSQYQAETQTQSSGAPQIDNSVTFSEGSIVVQIKDASPQEAENFVQLVIQRIKREQQLNNILSYNKG